MGREIGQVRTCRALSHAARAFEALWPHPMDAGKVFGLSRYWTLWREAMKRSLLAGTDLRFVDAQERLALDGSSGLDVLRAIVCRLTAAAGRRRLEPCRWFSSGVLSRGGLQNEFNRGLPVVTVGRTVYQHVSEP